MEGLVVGFMLVVSREVEYYATEKDTGWQCAFSDRGTRKHQRALGAQRGYTQISPAGI